jgi:hypothetical protein
MPLYDIDITFTIVVEVPDDATAQGVVAALRDEASTAGKYLRDRSADKVQDAVSLTPGAWDDTPACVEFMIGDPVPPLGDG